MVVRDHGRNIRRQLRALILCNDLLDLVRRIDKILAGLLQHVQRNHGLAVKTCIALPLLIRLDHRGNVSKVDRHALSTADHDVGDLVGRAELATHLDVASYASGHELAAGDVHVLG